MARRAQHDTQYWAQYVSQHQASGLTVREFCRREGIEVHHFYYGRKRLTSEASARQPQARQPDQAVIRKGTSAGGIAPASPIDAGQRTITIQLSQGTSVHVPAQMLDTIEALLKMAQRLRESESATAASAFRSVIVRS